MTERNDPKKNQEFQENDFYEYLIRESRRRGSYIPRWLR